jgi:superfamily II DNA/RNA helicase
VPGTTVPETDVSATAAPVTAAAPAVGVTFAELGVPAPIVKVLAGDGKATAFPIQTDSLPDTLAGRDVLGRGRTGSGKTLAFSIPMVARLGADRIEGEHHPGRPVGLVLAPTRELATQIADVISPLAGAYGLKVTTVYGGVKQHRQELAFRRGADIVVACPGRLEDLMGQGIVDLSLVDVTVIDEADYMADLGFLPGVTRILDATPSDGQRLLFSATLDRGVDKLVRRFLHNPVTHAISDPTETVSTMTHTLLQVPSPAEKKRVVARLAGGVGRRILFTRTKYGAQRLARQLTDQGIPSVDLQGNLSQNARDRNLAAFENGRANVLVATDVAARGVDVSGVAMVVHVDPPADEKAYLHRSGRTARAGADGQAVTVALPEQVRDMRHIFAVSDIDAAPQHVTGDSQLVADLEGERAPRVEPPKNSAPAAGHERPRRNGFRNSRDHDRAPRGERRSSDRYSDDRRGSDHRNNDRYNDHRGNDRYSDERRSSDRYGNSRGNSDRDNHNDRRSNDRFSSDRRSDDHRSSSRYGDDHRSRHDDGARYSDRRHDRPEGAHYGHHDSSEGERRGDQRGGFHRGQQHSSRSYGGQSRNAQSRNGQSRGGQSRNGQSRNGQSYNAGRRSSGHTRPQHSR